MKSKEILEEFCLYRESDEEIDPYYYRARHYDPQTGRFVQQDPIGLMGGDTNLYRYVFNNPVRYADPSGNFALGIELEAIGFLFQGGSVTGTAVVSIDLNPFSKTFLKTEVGILSTGGKKLGIGAAATAGANAMVAIGNSDLNDLSGYSVGASAGAGFVGGSVSVSGSAATLSYGFFGLPTQAFVSGDINGTTVASSKTLFSGFDLFGNETKAQCP